VSSLEETLRVIVREELERALSVQTPTGNPWLSLSALSEALGISRPTLRKLVAKGMPHIKPGDNMRFRLDEVEAWLRKGGGRCVSVSQPASMSSGSIARSSGE
jgi:excisionase family DNA binding protein